LLQTYEMERRQFHQRAFQESAQNYEDNRLLRPGLEDSDQGEALRQELAEQIKRTKPKNFQSLGVSLGYRYEGSPIVIPDGTPPTPFETSRYIPVARPGHRAPHWQLPDGSAIFDHFGSGFTLLHTGQPEAGLAALESSAAARGVPLHVERRLEPQLRRLYGANLILIRPDQHVAWRANEPPAQPDSLWDVVLGMALPIAV
jgi:hypothetical protein